MDNNSNQTEFTSEEVKQMSESIKKADIALVITGEIKPDRTCELSMAVLGTGKNLENMLVDAAARQPTFGMLLVKAALEYMVSQEGTHKEKTQEVKDLERRIKEKGGFNGGN